MEQEPKKTDKKKLIITIALILCLVIGVSYAFFKGIINPGAKVDVDLALDADKLYFEVDKELMFYITKDNLAEGGINVINNTKGTAKLLANSEAGTSTQGYDVVLDVYKNEFIYTTSDKKPEMILKVMDPTGNLVTSAEGLNYDSYYGGFDITEASGTFKISSNYQITSNSSTTPTTQTWNFNIIFVNLETNQAKNANKKFNGKIVLQNADKETFAEYLIAKVDEEESLTKHVNISDKTLVDYIYNGGDYKVADAYKTEYELVSDIIKNSSPGSASVTDPSYYLIYNSNNHYPNLTDAYSKALNDGRIVKDEVKNYVCFGSDKEECPNENLYRIIGVFDEDRNGIYQVKLIKPDFATKDLLGTDGEYYKTNDNREAYVGTNDNADYYYANYKGYHQCSSDSDYTFDCSLLNKINLNTNFLNSIDSKWSNKIDEYNWNISYIDWNSGFYNGLDYMHYLVWRQSYPKFTTKKIGLMYPYDMYFAIHNRLWENVYNRGISAGNYSADNWLHIGETEWTITSMYYSSSVSLYLNSPADNYAGGYQYEPGSYYDIEYGSETAAVRPTFYLKSDVRTYAGTGTSTDPYRIY